MSKTPEFKKIVKFRPAFDRRHPDPKKNYGIGCVSIFFVLVGEKGAVSFSCSTGIYLDHVLDEQENNRFGSWPRPMGYVVASCTPLPKGSKDEDGKLIPDCEWFPQPCKGDCNYLASDDVFTALKTKGDEGVWKCLEDYYQSWLCK